MTAILGLTFFGGVLMMSDTEETLGGNAKSTCDKLYRFIFSYGSLPGTVICGGAGDSHLIECANQEMQKFFCSELKDGDDILSSLNNFARNFFEETMRGYQGIVYELVPRFEMLIALNIKNNQTRLFCWKENRVLMLPADGHFSIGTGVAQIHPMLRDIQRIGRCDNMLFHGVRMMYHAKRAVTGVGGKTVAMALYDEAMTEYFGTEATEKIENLASNLDQFVNSVIYSDISAVRQDVQELDENINNSLAELPRIMNIYRDSYAKIIAPSTSRESED
jgi:hypothetical protein